MENPSLCSPIPAPRIGIFWIIPSDTGHRFLGRSLPFTKLAAVAGFKTFPTGHYEAWKRIARRNPSLAEDEYDDFPRGRVNWREDNGLLLLADRYILDRGLHTKIALRWGLTHERLMVLTDDHYLS